MKSFLSGLAAFLLCGVGLTACTTPSAGPSAIRIRWAQDPQTLEPLTATSSEALEVINLRHCSLLAGDYEQNRFAPWLAESFPVISRRDSLTLLTYTLRREATWDNGQPVLARDVAFTLKVMNCPRLPTEYSRTQYGVILDIELDATNPRRFTLVCNGSSKNVIIASGDYLILPEYSLDPEAALRAVPLPLLRTDTAAALRRYPALVDLASRYRNIPPEKQPGCGPYQLTAWTKNQYLRLQRKPNWWGSKLNKPPRWLQAQAEFLDYRIIPDNTTALLALRRGDIDLYPEPPASDFNRLRHSADSTKLLFSVADSYDVTMVGFNTQSPALHDPLTRRALSMLFDIPGLIRATQLGLAYRSVGLINPHDKPAYNDSLSLLVFAPQRALTLLSRAGWQQHPDKTWWRDKLKLALTILYRAGATDHEAIATQLRATARQLGIVVNLQPQENTLLRRQLQKGNMDMYVHTLNGTPYAYNFFSIMHSRGIGMINYPRFENAESDHLIEAITAEPNPSRQASLLRRFQVLLQQESPVAVLYFARHRLIASRRLGTVQAISARPGYDATQLQLASTRQ
jgi:peptide/nickel transport system substrate-binding protein